MAIFYNAACYLNCTGVPMATRSDNLNASQFVRRTQPCEFAYPIVAGVEVP